MEKIIKQIKENSQKGYNDSKPYWWYNHQSTEEKKFYIRQLTNYAFAGQTQDDENKEARELYLYAIASPQNKREVAELLVDVHTFHEVNVEPEMTEEEEKEYEELRDNYNGIDAYIYSAREEFYNNLTGDFADYDEIRKFFLD